MRVLFVMLHPGFTFYYESALRLLAERGHTVTVACERSNISPQLEHLAAEFPSITHQRLPKRKGDEWQGFSSTLRSFWDYLRYLDPRYRNAHYLRGRVEAVIDPALVRIAKRSQAFGPLGPRVLAWAARLLDRATPLNPVVVDFLRAQAPDVLLVTPLVNIGSMQVDYVRAAKQLGIRTGCCVASWDNLTNKGVMRVIPNRVFVWNQMQQDECVQLHGVPRDRVVITGAQNFDHWFGWKVRSSREQFCARFGFDPAQPFFLFVGSTQSIAATEPDFVQRWIEAVRHSGRPELERAGVLVRPHPKQTERWKDIDLSRFSNAAVWRASAPVDEDSRADYFDGLHHSAAVVGVNTSALIEAAIVGRHVYTLLAPEFADTQEGTLHFQHLLSVSGGLLHVSRGFDEHLAQLTGAIGLARAADDQQPRRFVQSFIRPHGLDRAAAPLLADGIEALAALGPAPAEAPPAWAPALRPVLNRLSRKANEARDLAARAAAAERI